MMAPEPFLSINIHYCTLQIGTFLLMDCTKSEGNRYQPSLTQTNFQSTILNNIIEAAFKLTFPILTWKTHIHSYQWQFAYNK